MEESIRILPESSGMSGKKIDFSIDQSRNCLLDLRPINSFLYLGGFAFASRQSQEMAHTHTIRAIEHTCCKWQPIGY
jgi:hypothetical protein